MEAPETEATTTMHERTVWSRDRLADASLKLDAAGLQVAELSDRVACLEGDIGTPAALSVKALVRLLTLLLQAIIAVAEAIEARAGSGAVRDVKTISEGTP